VGEEVNRLSVFGFILTGVLAVFLIVVVGDIPSFGDPDTPATKQVRLFGLAETGAAEILKQGIVPEGLDDLIQRRELPPIVRIERIPGREGEWDAYVRKREFFYPDEEKYYFIRKEGEGIAVFRHAFVVRWIEKGERETRVPNMVTYGLADYRGYDTLGETAVIFTAGVSVILLLRRREGR
jgi:multicomponent Na+:H+ antiporter subunit B